MDQYYQRQQTREELLAIAAELEELLAIAAELEGQ
jgi:hypothetical protein